ncbi:Uracil DNA glycosylase superfamily protein [Lentilactobacillus parabuchneri]|jgi:DNA polymerase|uniref:Uracil DNA glycosylase superfamily protein n=3 Tax=Lentilactobacillus parabuchneri TaxID=152331 RepID=A0A1X1FH40_9LACO|nr:uracil-DNA glycosylase [Lentilactobacillus parabuchneri]KRM46849.1 uracil-DNA glycosylase [Lentilactobacillus parabuchneri DSM 5707 = NBRC 107865]APR06762.1 Uracil DNA glycosylase superfamily protein [Lentilactobacillus parabuchneri]KRN78030.1 uracil-DNA glycosylase [Lentilactobacillus parabuchneri]ORN03250.1 Uracil DNA glycosylase superfamily protein [Lentilactobacillus parabuchneri]ORN05493.1 Uracil DNA glycosylase superfamily protein [Lentilactobacillus parabuchneri]
MMTLHTILTPEWIHRGKLIAAENPRLEGFVPSEGGENPRILLLGEAPGDKEVRLGRPFMGPSGKELDRWLASLGLSREDIYITGVVNSRPFSIGKTGRKRDRRPNQTEVKTSAPMFDWELAHFPDVLLVPMGNASLQRLLGNQAKVGDLHGQLLNRPIQQYNQKTGQFELTKESYRIFPLYHPSYSKRFKNMKEIVDADSHKLKALLSQS